MQTPDILREANRQLSICNACRYCEGYCAVFPAMERRRAFTEGDILYLANLCHDCRDCYTACMYAPPHEFNVNIPAMMSDVRLDVYERYASPRMVGRALRKQKVAVVGTVVASMLLLVLAALIISGPRAFTSAHRGPGAFYTVVPYALMWIPFTAVSLYVVFVWIAGTVRFWLDTYAPLRGPLQIRALVGATIEAMNLRWLRGGGAGCDYPGPRGSYSRMMLHFLVFYGFISALAATVLAAVYQDIFGVLPPFAVLSAPVIFGIAGGIGLVAGSTGFLYLKLQADPVPSNRHMTVLDYAFLMMLDLVAISGLVLLVLRDSRLMGLLLAVHLGSVLGLFLTAPYGKFVHFVYRYAALVQNRLEERAGVD